jgi:aminocarboxymuconate-semialdehyde decarboxylase
MTPVLNVRRSGSQPKESENVTDDVTGGTPDSAVVDAHAHIVPRTLLAELADHPVHGFSAAKTDKGWVVDVPGMGATRPIGARMVETGLRQDWLAATGVTEQVLSPWMDVQAARLDPADGRDWARRVNDWMCASVAELAGAGTKTTALATVATDDPEQAAADLLAVCERPEIAGLLLSTNPLTGPALHEPAFEPLWTVAEEHRIPIMLHPPTVGPASDLSSIGTLGNVYGRLVDNTLAVTELILHGLLDAHPGLKLVLVHGGGFLPYQGGRLDGGYRTKEAFAGELARGKPSAYLGDFHYDTVALSGAAIGLLAGLVGADRVLLGSDFPFALGDPQPVRTVRELGLGEKETDAILRGTAAEVFGG